MPDGSPSPLSRTLMHQALQALQYLHRQGVVHHGIKPQNLLLTQQGEAKLSDMGLSRRLLPGGSPTGAEAGRSPDSARGCELLTGVCTVAGAVVKKGRR